jgi:hypothetical protein
MLNGGTSFLRFALAVAGITTLTVELRAQPAPERVSAFDPNWSRLVSMTPSSLEMQGRSEHMLAFDRLRGRVVLFGGAHSSVGGDHVGSNDTWEWDGVTGWVERMPATRPPPRLLAAMAHDEARGTILLFGGKSGISVARDDTWTWDGTDWQELSPPSKPPPMMGALACDAARRTCLLFGGLQSAPPPDGSTGRGGTWEWDGTTWTERLPAASPPVRGWTALTYDRKRGKMVLFGGERLDDTWEWDGSSWTELSPTTRPSARGGHVLAYHEALGKVVLFGGCERIFNIAGLFFCEEPNADMWSWDGVDWTRVFPSANPAARFKSAMTYDSGRQKLVMFGGNISVVTDAGPAPPGGFEPIKGNTWTWSYGDGVDADAGAEDDSTPPLDGCSIADCDPIDVGPTPVPDAIEDSTGSADAIVGADASIGDVGSADGPTPSDPGQGSGSLDGNSACSCTHVATSRRSPRTSATLLLLLLFARQASSRFKRNERFA